MKKFINHIRLNGKTPLLEGRPLRELVYANMIWFCTFSAFVIYCICVPLLHITRSPVFFSLSAVWVTAFSVYYFLIKLKFHTTGKYWLLYSTNLMVISFDLAMNRTGFNYLYLFAFLPTAMNIFSLGKNKVTVISFTLLPLVYMVFSRITETPFPFESIQPDPYALKQLDVINLVLSFCLFVLFAGYMILNNIAKQHRLLTQGISLQATLDNSDASIWSIDNNYNLTVANSKYLRSIAEEFTDEPLKPGNNLRTHSVWEKLPAHFKEHYGLVLSGREIIEEAALNDRIYEIKAVPIYDQKGKIHGATFGSRDITVRKRAGEMLLKAKKAAEDADKAKARFISNMSHEIRTPLNGINGIARILQDEDHLPAQVPHLKTLEDLSEHTVQIVNNILDFAKIEAGKAELESKRFNIYRFVEKMKSIFSGTAQLKGLKFNIETEGNTDVFVKADEVRLSQVLINLLGNAFKFTESGSVTLKVAVHEHPEKKHYKVQFDVTDTGIGIKSEHAGRIFESFTQADTNTTRRFGGTGLGLSIATKIVSLMGGKLQVESSPGKQTSFSFEVRLHMSSAVKEQPLLTATPVTKNIKPLRILVAEDNKVNQLVARKILEKWKHQIVVANNGKEAVEHTAKAVFDIVLMDLDMPVMDGYEATEIIRQQKPQLPVIALTAASFDDMNNFLSKKGFINVVQKPFAPEDLLAKIILAANSHYHQQAVH